MRIVLKKNTGRDERRAYIKLTSSNESIVISLVQLGSSVETMDVSEVEDLDKYYKPEEFSGMDMLKSDAQWSWFRSKQSEHFFVFWEAGFGDDPNSEEVPEALRVDIDDLLEKAEQFYTTNINTLKMVEVGQGKSYLDEYKMEIYLLYQTEWLATGSGYDNVIGALWVNPSTCQPVGSTIGHEIGHSFQYQVYCDKVKQGEPNDLKHGFRYGYDGSNGGCGFWEQCAQWQSFQEYPVETFESYNFDVWLANCHRHFEHEWMRYASYWLQYYWARQHGITTVGEIWNKSAYPDDAIETYMRLYNGDSWETTKKELYDYAARMATFDIDGLREYATNYQGRYSTKLYSVADGYYQVAYATCPSTTGFNVIALNVPEAANSKVSVTFSGLDAGSALAADDPGEYMKSEAVAGNVSNYNNNGKGKEGWAYGFVALLSNGQRVYGDMNTDRNATVSFAIPANTERLFLVVQGSPTEYRQCPWDEEELTDDQWPYKVKFTGTDLLGNFNIDETAAPADLTLSYNLTCDASSDAYEQGTIDLQSNGDIKKLAQAFVMQATVLSGNTSTIANGLTGVPAEGKVVLGLMDASGNISYSYSANTGFYCNADGSVGSWGDGAPVYVEYDKDKFAFTYGHRPGNSVVGTKYTIRPTLVYTKNGKQYKATFILNLQF